MKLKFTHAEMKSRHYHLWTYVKCSLHFLYIKPCFNFEGPSWRVMKYLKTQISHWSHTSLNIMVLRIKDDEGDWHVLCTGR